jgi:hypothetical protein
MAVVTFTTDFGTADAYAAAMKGVVLSLAPSTVLVDITHEVPRHDVAAGALVLAQAAASFPAGTIHVAVVDPGVGGERAEVVVEAGSGIFVGPDNGLLAVASRPPRQAYRIDNPSFRREPASPTFHGRDVFAVAAGRIAAGAPPRDAGVRMEGIVELKLAEDGPISNPCEGRVLYIDSFGNLVTSLTAGDTGGRWRLVHDGGSFEAQGGRTFSDVAAGELVLYLGSNGRIEIAVRDGSAAERVAAEKGARFELRRLS